MSKQTIIQDDSNIIKKVNEVTQDKWDERAKAFLRRMWRVRPYFRKWWPVMLILFLCLIMENFLSAFGAYNYIYQQLIGWIGITKYTTSVVIGCAILIEVLKQILGLSFFRKAFSIKIDYYQGSALIMITVVSMLSTKWGTESSVYNYSVSPILISTDSINNYYDQKIKVKDNDIDYYQEKATTQKANWKILNVIIPNLDAEKNDLDSIRNLRIMNAELENEETLRNFNSDTKTTASKVGKGVWLFNLISLFISAILGYMIYKSAVNYEVIDKDTGEVIASDTTTENINTLSPKTVPDRATSFQEVQLAENREFRDVQPDSSLILSDDFQPDLIPDITSKRVAEVEEQFKTVPLDKVVAKLRNGYKRRTTCKELKDRERNEQNFQDAYIYLTSKGYVIKPTSEVGLTVQHPNNII